MERIANYPLLVFAVSFLTLWLSARLGRHLLLKQSKPDKELREDFNIILAATPDPAWADYRVQLFDGRKPV